MTSKAPAVLPADKRRASHQWRWPDFVALGLLLAFAITLQLRSAGSTLSFDELWHLSLSVGKAPAVGWFAYDVLYESPARMTTIKGAPGLWQVWTGMAGVLHPPLYVTTLRLWREIFGDGDRVAQLYSITWAAVAIAATFAAVRLAMGRALAIVITLAVCCAQTQVYFAQEVRGYAMLIGLAAIALWLMQRVEAFGITRGGAIGVALMTLPILLTHYFGAGGAVAIALYGLIRFRGQRRAFIAALAAAAIVYGIVWLPFALRQLAYIGTGDEFMHVAKVEPLHELSLLAAAPLRLIVDRTATEQPEWMLGGLLFVLPCLCVRRSPWLLPWALWLSCAAGSLAVLDVARSTSHLALVRYVAVASPAVVPLLVGTIRALDRRLAYLAGVCVAFMGAIYFYSGNDVTADSQDFAPVVHALEARIQPGEAILAHAGKLPPYFGNMLLLTCSHSPTLFPRPVVNLTKPASPELMARLPRRVWVMTGPLEMPLESLLPGSRMLLRYNADFRVGLVYLELPDATATRPIGP